MDLEQRIITEIRDIVEVCGGKVDRTELAMDVSIAMNDRQRNDLACMISYMRSTDTSVAEICTNILHDLHGLRCQHLGDGEGFVPRSSGYADAVNQ